ncbi:MAG: dihydroorotase [Candidatus Bathyarchaeota archaeon]
MSLADLTIENTKLVFSSTIVEAGLAIKNGKIVRIAKDANLPKADLKLNCKGLLTFPGVIDSHVHFRDPGLTYKEDFSTGSMAAAAGGVTVVVDMPTTIPPLTNLESFKIKIEAVKSKSYVDYGFLGLLSTENIDEISKLTGVLGFKLFMADFLGKHVTDDFLYNAFNIVKKLGLPVAVHAENLDDIIILTNKVRCEGRKDIYAYTEARPGYVEAKAIARVSSISEKVGAKIHVCHVSSRDGVKVLGEVRGRGLRNVTCETCPHYLLLNIEELSSASTAFKVTPPLKFKHDVEALWRGIHEGVIDTIASDHAPHTYDEKFKNDVWEASSGFIGVEILVPLMLTQVVDGRLNLNQFTKLLCENPAKVYGLYPLKGCIKVNSDADLTIVKLGVEEKIKADKLHSKSGFTPFNGWTVKAKPVYTIVRGSIVMENGEIVGKPSGKLVKPQIKSNSPNH